MPRRSLGILLATALAVPLTAIMSPSPAQAAIEDCPEQLGAFCLWQNQDFTGPMKLVTDFGCLPASAYGLSAIGSAKRYFGINSLAVYSGEDCTGTETEVTVAGVVLDPPAKSFFLLPT